MEALKTRVNSIARNPAVGGAPWCPPPQGLDADGGQTSCPPYVSRRWRRDAGEAAWTR